MANPKALIAQAKEKQKALIESQGANFVDAANNFNDLAKSDVINIDTAIKEFNQGIEGATYTPAVAKVLDPEPGEIPDEPADPTDFVDDDFEPLTITVTKGQQEEPKQLWKTSLVKNELKDFASYNTILELAVLAPDEINSPDVTYRQLGPRHVIARSGGGLGPRKTQVATEKALNRYLEYFIDNVEIDSLIVANTKSQNTNASTINFEVTEPYSMGMFFQSLYQGAVNAGYASYVEACFLLTIKFVGYNDNGDQLVAPTSTRMIPIKINNIEFSVDGAGSNYAIKAYAWNDQAFADRTQKIKTDVSITGRTVSELLQSGAKSLATIINGRFADLEEKGQANTADQIVIMFPSQRSSAKANPASGEGEDTSNATVKTDESQGVQDPDELWKSYSGLSGKMPNEFTDLLNAATGKVAQRSRLGEAIRAFAEAKANTNKIGSSKIIDSFIERGHVPFGEPAFVYDKEKQIYKRQGTTIEISDENRIFTFKAGTRIQELIEEVVIVSTYGRSLARQLEDITANNGMIDWFRIESQVYVVPDNSEITRRGELPKVYVYRVVPYKVHHSKFKAPTATGAGYGFIKKNIAKQYNYIYTGKNDDILDLEIKFNHSFMAPMAADRGEAGKDERLSSENARTKNADQSSNVTGQGNGSYPPVEGTVATEELISSYDRANGGSSVDNKEIAIARMFNRAFIQSDVDMVNLQMQIMGDPYYLSDSGLGNYNAGDTSFTNINSDGSMNYQNGEVDVNLVFRTPVDIMGENYAFPEDTNIVKNFSGIYQVTKVNHSISGNNFTQDLTLLRRRDQNGPAVYNGVGLIQTGTKDQSMNDNGEQTGGSGAGGGQSGVRVEFVDDIPPADTF
jgi:hypothetical protein